MTSLTGQQCFQFCNLQYHYRVNASATGTLLNKSLPLMAGGLLFRSVDYLILSGIACNPCLVHVNTPPLVVVYLDVLIIFCITFLLPWISSSI